MIVDTDVLIWELKGNPKAQAAIHAAIPFDISVVTYMEVVQGMRNKRELNMFLKQLSRWQIKILQIDQEISTRAMIFVEEYFLSHTMQLADALIAATCIASGETILTGNERHYKHIPNISIEKFIS